jgi:hypothetical protein
MAERGTVLVPTLSTFHDLAERFAGEFAPRLVEQAKRQAEEAARTLLAAHAAGVTLAMGYDSGPPGASANELVRMAETGLGAAAAIRRCRAVSRLGPGTSARSRSATWQTSCHRWRPACDRSSDPRRMAMVVQAAARSRRILVDRGTGGGRGDLAEEAANQAVGQLRVRVRAQLSTTIRPSKRRRS